MISPDRPNALLWLTAGFIVWSAAFLALYGLHALACEWGWGVRRLGPVSLLQIALLTVWGLNLAIVCTVTVLAWRLRRGTSRNGSTSLVRDIALSLNIAALAATVWIGVPILMVPVCI